jgi:hypothetical protein
MRFSPSLQKEIVLKESLRRQMRAVPISEVGHNRFVEVKIIKGDAQVVWINNLYLKGEVGCHDFFPQQHDLFTKKLSQIVITPIDDTKDVHVVEEWSNLKIEIVQRI